VTASELFPILDAVDPDALADFYERGLGAEPTYRWPAGDEQTEYVFLRLEPLGLGIARAADRQAQGGIALWAYVDDVDAAVERLETLGGRAVEPPADRPWGERTATVEDPAGHVLHLGQRLPAS
jgi:uncharacterized glyoxalase superfamily protein PhnB